MQTNYRFFLFFFSKFSFQQTLLLHFLNGHFDKSEKTNSGILKALVSFYRLYLMLKLLTTFITFFTSDDSRLYQIPILQASISLYRKRL